MPVIDREGMGGQLILHGSAKIAESASIDVSADVHVYEDVGIAEEALILTHAHEHGHHGPVSATPLLICRGAFIGERAIILPQVRVIGEGAVIGAGAVVTRDVPAGETWAGNPARRTRRIKAKQA
jgi:hypothetical protein